MGELMLLIAACAPAIHPATAASLVQAESGGNPLAIGINGGARLSRPPATAAQAAAAAKALIAAGFSVDLGLAQINSRNLARLGLSVEDAFVPCRNLAAMQAVLQENYTRAAAQHGEGQRALQAALSAYNAGDPVRGLRNGYVETVYRQARTATTTQPTR